MKMSKKLLAGCLLFAAILSGITLLNVSADNVLMTSQQIEQIRNNCVLSKSTLNQLHASDALLRVNMGQVYESMSTKLMARFNSRVVKNGFSNTSLVVTTTSYEQMLDVFRSDYIIYEEHLTSAINIDCTNQPVAFYDAIDLARSKRSQVYSDVVNLNQYIDQYQSAVSQFAKDYAATTNGAKQ